MIRLGGSAFGEQTFKPDRARVGISGPPEVAYLGREPDRSSTAVNEVSCGHVSSLPAKHVVEVFRDILNASISIIQAGGAPAVRVYDS